MIKEFKTWLILDYKTGNFRVVKKKMTPKASEIPIQLTLNVTIPEMPSLKATGEITLSQTQINKMVIEEI